MRVRYTRNAAAELAAILDYIAERSPNGARRVQTRIVAAERMLAPFPEIGQASSRKPWVRRLVVQPYPYLIFYEVAGNEIWIQRIRHGARNPEEN